MQTITSHLQQIWKQVREYADTRFTIVKLKATDAIAGVISSVIISVLIIIASLFFLLLISIGVAVWLNYFLSSTFAGFLVIGLFYGIIGMILFGVRKRLFRVILTRYILRKLMKLHE